MASSCAATGAPPRGDRLAQLKTSPNYREDRFVNRLPARRPPLLKALREWLKGNDHAAPEQPVPVVARARADFASSPSSGLRVTWLGHSTSLVEIDGHRVLLDPTWSRRISPVGWAGPKRFFDPPLPLDELPPLDAVLISHDHFDHLDQATVERLAAAGTRFIAPLGVGSHLEHWGIPAAQVTELDWWRSVRLGELTVVATPARHFSGRSLVMADRNETLWAGFAILGPEHRVYYSGDTGMFPGFAEIGQRLGPFDAVLLEVGAYNQMWADLHLGPEQAVAAFRQVRGELLIPVHWGTFTLALHSWTEPVERLLVAAQQAGAPVVVPRPGQRVEPLSPPVQVRWWPEVPWQTAQEHPVVSSGVR